MLGRRGMTWTGTSWDSGPDSTRLGVWTGGGCSLALARPRSLTGSFAHWLTDSLVRSFVRSRQFWDHLSSLSEAVGLYDRGRDADE